MWRKYTLRSLSGNFFVACVSLNFFYKYEYWWAARCTPNSTTKLNFLAALENDLISFSDLSEIIYSLFPQCRDSILDTKGQK